MFNWLNPICFSGWIYIWSSQQKRIFSAKFLQGAQKRVLIWSVLSVWNWQHSAGRIEQFHGQQGVDQVWPFAKCHPNIQWHYNALLVGLHSYWTLYLPAFCVGKNVFQWPNKTDDILAWIWPIVRWHCSSVRIRTEALLLGKALLGKYDNLF